MSIKMTTKKEKDFFEKICALSLKDTETVRDVLRSLLLVVAAEMYSDSVENEIYIPYLCKLKVHYKNELKRDEGLLKKKNNGKVTKVFLEAFPSETLIKEVEAIDDGEEPPSLHFIKSRIEAKISKIMDLIPLEGGSK